MKCPYCGLDETRVVDSRPSDEGTSIRRRRVCDNCGKRFTTYEKVETIPMIVIKKDRTFNTVAYALLMVIMVVSALFALLNFGIQKIMGLVPSSLGIVTVFLLQSAIALVLATVMYIITARLMDRYLSV